MPQAAADHVRRWQGDLGLALRVAPQKGRALRRDWPRISHRLDHQRLLKLLQRPLLRRRQAGIGHDFRRQRLRAVLGAPKTRDHLREDFKVADAPPLAVRDDVDAGALLQADGESDGLVQGRVQRFVAQLAALMAQQQVNNPLRARQTADDAGGEQCIWFHKIISPFAPLPDSSGRGGHVSFYPIPGPLPPSPWRASHSNGEG